MSKGIRQFHRWLSVAFTLGFIVNAVVAIQGIEPPTWVYFLALVPLFLLLPTGLYMFVLPYLVRKRGGTHQVGG